MIKSDAKKRSDESAIHCQDYDEETGQQVFLVQSQYKDECDLNVIIGRLTPEQLEDRLAASQGVYGDFYDVMSYSEAKQLVINAEQAFDRLDAKLRKQFDNDPQKLIEFLDDPTNDEEAIKLGLKAKPKVQEPVEGPVSSPKDTE